MKHSCRRMTDARHHSIRWVETNVSRHYWRSEFGISLFLNSMELSIDQTYVNDASPIETSSFGY